MDGSDVVDGARPAGRLAQLDSLTGLRAIAAGAVFLSHVRAVMPVDHLVVTNAGYRLTVSGAMAWGACGVSVFFVLSGFVLTWSFRAQPATSFFRRRVARIWPSNAVVWAVFIVFGIVGIAKATAPAPAIASLFLVQTWFPGLGWANAGNPLAWTLSCEAFFYLMFPLLYRYLSPLRPRAMAVAAAAWAGFGFLTVVAYLAPQRITVSTFPPFRIYEFALGMLLAMAIQRGLIRRAPSLWWSGAAFFAALYLSDFRSNLNGLISLGPAFISVLIIARLVLVELEPGGATRRHLLRTPTMTYFGQVSFAFYLVQFVPPALITWWLGAPDGLGQQWTWTFLWTAGTVVLAVGLHHLVERPAQRWMTRPVQAVTPAPGVPEPRS